MIRFNVIRLKPAVKKIIVGLTIIICIYVLSMFFLYIGNNSGVKSPIAEENFILTNNSNISIFFMENTSNIITSINNKGKVYIFNRVVVNKLQNYFFGCTLNGYRDFMTSQIPVMKLYETENAVALVEISEQKIDLNKEENLDIEEGNEEIKSIQDILGQNDVKESENENVKEITILPSEKHCISGDGIHIKNETEKEINIPSLLKEDIKINISRKDPSVLIVHTHTSESYTPTEKYSYVQSDPDRTENEDYNVTRVGAELKDYLLQEGIKVLHDRTCHDYPSYNGSYRKALTTIANNIEENSSISVVFDIHRDAFSLEDGKKLKVTSIIDDEKVAQVMLVVGTDELGLKHEHWKENLKFALHLQQKLNSLYPNIARPVNLRKERFNQHATYGSLIIEVGSNGNTLEEALATTKYLGKAIAQTIKEIEDDKI